VQRLRNSERDKHKITTMSIINPYSKKRPRQDSNTESSRFPEKRGHYFESTRSSLIPTTSSNSAIHRKGNDDPLQDDVSALIISASNKAGMEGIDRTRIDAIILRESGDSLFMRQQRKRDDRVNQRIQQMKQKLREYQDRTCTDAIPATNREIEEQLASYRRPSRSTAVVVDMDMFYMACELLTRPELHHKPACVGGGMISTSNYCARKYGVRSAMPGFIGDKLVEELSGGKEKLVHVDHHFSLYKEKSKQVLEVLAEFDPFSLRAYSLDEAFMELGPYLAVSLQHPTWSHEHIRQVLSPKGRSKDLHEQEQESDAGKENSEKAVDETSICQSTVQNDVTIADLNKQEQQPEDNPQPVTPLSCYRESFAEILETYPCSVCLEKAGQIMADLRHRVTLRTSGLTCSAGLAPNFMIAKIASDQNKPNGQCIVDPAELLEFLHPMSTRKIPGIGRVTAKLLQAFGISTVQDLYERRGLVQFLFQPITARSLLRASVGCDSSSSFGDNNNNNHSDDDDEDPTTGSASFSSKREPRKGMSRERTFSAESSWTQLNTRLEDIARLLSKDMCEKQVVSHTITVKVSSSCFIAAFLVSVCLRNI
jgi:nucleotidyltransferase/DNA polymerase involved in DNA repair